MRLGTCREFCDLVETKSFTRTAERHGVTQSAITQNLHALERKMSARLADRKGHRFKLTPAGELCHQHFREMLRLAKTMDHQLEQARVAAGGVIELAACYSIGLHQLPPVLRQYRRDFPDVEVRVHYGLIDRVHEEVRDNAMDLGLVCYPRRLHGLTVDLFRHERLMLVCHPQHPIAARPAVGLMELTGQKFVAWNEIRWSPVLRNVPDNLRHLFEPYHEFNEVEMVKRVVELDGGIAFLPETTIQPEVAQQRLTAVPFENGGFTEPLAVIYRQCKTLTPAMTSFIQALKQPAGVAD